MTTAPIGGPYATVADMHSWLKVPDSKTDRDAEWTARLASSSMDINRWCNRQFGRDEVASTRTYRPDRYGVDVDDFWTTQDLVITPYLGTTAGTAWNLAYLQLEPLNGIVDQVPGWPYRRIRSMYSRVPHPLMTQLFYAASTVQVTARWGWAEVPVNVTTACLILAAADNKVTETPTNASGYSDYGVRIRSSRIQSNPVAQEKLEPYVFQGTASNSYLVAAE